ncbi:MAG TPA: hypothetical protein VK137_01985, partial [Planctomycetaceae bacterium]|nr:hypothetical protein [Planctomycetaceae bacterium]
MSVVRFQCPNCQAPLRLENRALFLGRTFACPDCGETLLIEAHGADGVSARPTKPVAEEATAPSKPTAARPPHAAKFAPAPLDFGAYRQSRISAWDTLSRRPALLGWSVALLFAIVLFVMVTSGREQNSRVPLQIDAGKSPASESQTAVPPNNSQSPATAGSTVTTSDRAAVPPAMALKDRKDAVQSVTLEPVAVPSQPRADADRADG